MKTIITLFILSFTTISFGQKTIDLTFRVISDHTVMSNATLNFYSIKADTLLYQATTNENGVIQWKNAPKTDFKAVYYDSTYLYKPCSNYFYAKGLSTTPTILAFQKLSNSDYNSLMSALENSTSESILEVVNDNCNFAEYTGGREAMVQFLQRNIHIPISAEAEGIDGKVYLRFVIETDGTIKDLEVKKGLTPETDFESMLVISKMPKWIPSNCDGKAVPCYFILPISFKVI